MQTLTKELREALDDKTDMSGRHDAVRRKLTQIRKMWIQHMSKEKKRSVCSPLLASMRSVLMMMVMMMIMSVCLSVYLCCVCVRVCVCVCV